MGEVNYTLPEWAILSSWSHQGELLPGRTVLIQPKTFSIVEVIPIDNILETDLKGPSMGVEYANEEGLSYKVCFCIYFTLSTDIDGIFEKVANWYGEYLDWNDQNKLLEEKMKRN
jgi:hypothetical protein